MKVNKVRIDAKVENIVNDVNTVPVDTSIDDPVLLNVEHSLTNHFEKKNFMLQNLPYKLAPTFSEEVLNNSTEPSTTEKVPQEIEKAVILENICGFLAGDNMS